jgi:hypothetical protein
MLAHEGDSKPFGEETSSLKKVTFDDYSNVRRKHRRNATAEQRRFMPEA